MKKEIWNLAHVIYAVPIFWMYSGTTGVDVEWARRKSHRREQMSSHLYSKESRINISMEKWCYSLNVNVILWTKWIFVGLVVNSPTRGVVEENKFATRPTKIYLYHETHRTFYAFHNYNRQNNTTNKNLKNKQPK